MSSRSGSCPWLLRIPGPATGAAQGPGRSALPAPNRSPFTITASPAMLTRSTRSTSCHRKASKRS
jgi:hypothetical protein